MQRLLLTCIALIMGTVAASAQAQVQVQAQVQNTDPAPALEGYTAHPSIRVFGDTCYLYPTSDKPNWMTTDFSVWTSKNLLTWKTERMVLDDHEYHRSVSLHR